MTETSAAELDDLRSAVRDLLSDKCGEEQIRKAIETDLGYDHALWMQLATQLGAQSLSLPEEFGGDGFGYVELGIFLSEMGRRLMPGPFLSSVVLAGSALALSGDEGAQADYLPRIADGSLVATLAVTEADGRWGTDEFTTTATEDSGRWTLNGVKTLVPDGNCAGLILVAATTTQGPALFAVDPGAAGVTCTPLRTLDLTRQIARVELDGVEGALVGQAGDAAEVLASVLDRAMVALAAEQVGAARACLEMAVGYARERVQFGRAIGSFQAIKHKCADMFAKIELASATSEEALRALDGLPDAPPAPIAAAVAHAVCSEAFMFVAMETIQVHGGIAFTWEHPAHLYFRRAKATQLMFGGPAEYYERFLQRAGV